MDLYHFHFSTACCQRSLRWWSPTFPHWTPNILEVDKTDIVNSLGTVPRQAISRTIDELFLNSLNIESEYKNAADGKHNWNYRLEN